MPRYSITVQAMIAKTYEVDAIDTDFAFDLARERFNSEPDSSETYGQEIIDYRLIEPEAETYVVSSIAELRDVLSDFRGNLLQTGLAVQVDKTGKITIEPVKG